MPKDNRKFNDRGYRKLFEFASLVEDLVRLFVHLDMLDQIDFGTLRRVNASHVTRDLSLTESDMLWQVQTRNGPLLLYLLFEFQSKSDRLMALRLLHFLTSFYTGTIHERENGKQPSTPPGSGQLLPPVLPLVLYNGRAQWSAPLDIQELIESSVQALRPHIPAFSYYLVALNEIAPTSLQALDSIMAKIFIVDTAPDLAAIPTAVEHIAALLQETAGPELAAVIRRWIAERLSRKGLGRGVDLTSLTPKEVPPMLEETIDKFKKTAYEAGRRAGRKAGREEAAAEYEARLREIEAENDRRLHEVEVARQHMAAELERLRHPPSQGHD